MTIYFKKPGALEDTWKAAKSLWEETPDMPDPETTQIPQQAKAQGRKSEIVTIMQPVCSLLADLVTSGPKGGVDWNKVDSVVPELEAAFQLEIDLLKRTAQHRTKEEPRSTGDSVSAGKETAQPVPSKTEPEAKSTDPAETLLNEGIEVSISRFREEFPGFRRVCLLAVPRSFAFTLKQARRRHRQHDSEDPRI